MGRRFAREDGFRYRGQEIQRIETFSDAVFAFAIALLIVSLEVPKNFDELMISMRGFIAFGICFLFLFIIWLEQHMFFRRYGLEDKVTVFLNGILLFIVLFYVYPLKFLFSLIFSDSIYGPGKSPFSIKEEQVPRLMVIYSVGYIFIYIIFLLLYMHAHRCRRMLDLTALEIFDTRSKIWSEVILISIGCCSMLAALILEGGKAGLAGMIYILIGPVIWVFYARRERRRNRLHGV